MSYVKVKDLIENWTGLRRSPETYRRWVVRVGKFIEEQRKKKCAQIFENPSFRAEEYGKDPDYLFLEADGCYIYMRILPPLEGEIQKGSTQKASAKKEVRLGLWYEGKRPRRGTEGNGKFEVTGKTYFGGMMGVEEFWETAAMTGVERYGLGPLTQVFGGGDGGNWIGSHFEDFKNSLYVLCRYHWKRDIFRIFPEEKGKKLILLVESNEKGRVNSFIDEEYAACREEKTKKKMAKLKKYILNQWEFIQNYRRLKEKLKEADPALLRVGVIEGHIYQVLYLRFESRGGYWSEEGLNALLHVLMAELNGNLAQLLRVSGWDTRAKASVVQDIKKTGDKKPKMEPTCVRGSFPVLTRPVSTLGTVIKQIAHPERKRVA